MKKERIVGVCGSMGSGKDTVGLILKDLGFVDELIAFASGVKECASEYFNIPKDERSINSRSIWQKIGHDFRKIHYEVFGNEDIWINYLLEKKIKKIDKRYVIIDVRFSNEAKSILDRGGVVFFVFCDADKRKKRIEKRDNKKIEIGEWLKMNSHPSEYFSQNWDNFKLDISGDNNSNIIFLDNNKDLVELKKQIQRIVSNYE